MNLKFSQRRQFLAERVAEGKRITIGFAGIADLRSFIGLEYLNGMKKACEDYDLNFINMGGAVKYSLFDDIHFIQNYLKNFKFMRAPFVDGLVTWSSSFWDFMKEELITSTFSQLQPLPMVDIGHMNIPDTTHLKINSNAAIKMMIDHLAEVHGYTKFAFFGADVSQPHWNRLNAYQKELRQRNIPELKNSVYMAKSMAQNHIAEKVEELISAYEIKNKKNIEAIVTTTDIIASEIIEVLAKHDISVPKDIAVTGFNNWYEGITSRSPLTTIDLCYYKRGYAAIEVLIDKIIQPDQQSQTILFQPSLVIRQSCGCLEHKLQNHLLQSKDMEALFSNLESESEEELRNLLKQQLKLTTLTEDPVLEVIDHLFYDIYSNPEESKTLLWFQNIVQTKRKEDLFKPEAYQNFITNLRTLILPILKHDGADTLIRAENILHKMRSLVSEFQTYESLADRENPYKMNNLSEQAINFTSANSLEDIFEILKKQLGEFDIPGVALALSEKMTLSFPSPQLKMIYPEPSLAQKGLLGIQITEPHLFPKEAFPTDRRYSLMLEVLHYADYYFGYAFFELKKDNIAVYDVLRMLLSNALYLVYKKSNQIQIQKSPTREQVENLINPETKIQKLRTRLTAEQISRYLTERIGEKTDIQKMSNHFMVSKSYLSQKTKELTGFSVQILHEKIKIEQAKNMLLMESFELSEIADNLGFANQNYFSNVFKKNTGKSPKNWLKNRT